jgi:hypothetical protein
MSILRRIFSWRTFRALLFVVIALVTLVALAIAFENWRGKRAWLKFKAAQEAKGERFDLASFIPPRVPDADNLAMTPFLAPLFDYTRGPGPVWRDSNALARTRSVIVSDAHRQSPRFGNREKGERTDLRLWQQYYQSSTNFPISRPGESPGAEVLQALSKYDAIFMELREAAKRPQASFPIYYDESISALLPHLEVLKSIAVVLRLRALAALDANQPEEAIADVRLSLRLAEALKSEPLLVSQLFRITILRLVADTVWEGIATGRWNDQHLAQLQAAFSSIDLLSDYERAMRGERAFGNDFLHRIRAGQDYGSGLEHVTRLAPLGLIYQNQLNINRMYQRYLFGVIDPAKRRIDVERATSGHMTTEFRRWHPYKFMAGLLLPALDKSSFRFAHGQTVIDQVVLACALERYRLAKGEYPATLEQLTPEFVRAIPHDVISGERLHYSRTAPDKFILYSVGWNQKDDRGAQAPPGITPSRQTSGDWVWMPAPRSTN